MPSKGFQDWSFLQRDANWAWSKQWICCRRGFLVCNPSPAIATTRGSFSLTEPAATVVERREAAKIQILRDICTSINTPMAAGFGSKLNVLRLFDNNTSLDEILHNKFSSGFVIPGASGIVAMADYTSKMRERIVGLCLECMRNRTHEKKHSCF